MAILDIILLLCFIPAIVNGISKGFVKQVVDLISILAGAWLAFHFSSRLTEWLGTMVEWDPKVLQVVGFLIVATIAILIIRLIGTLITKLLKGLSLGWINHLLGLVFGILTVALVLGLLIMAFEGLNSTLELVKPEELENATVYGALRDFAHTVFPYLKTFVTGTADA